MNPNPVNLTAIYHHCIFRSASRVAFHEETARELADHRLRWREGEADTVLHKVQLREIGIYVLRYGAEVEIRPRTSNDFIVVHWSLRGLVEIVCDGQRAVLLPGQTIWMSPRRSWDMRWQAGSEQLILKVPRNFIGASRRFNSGGLPSFGLLPARFDAQWLMLVQTLLSAVSGPAQTEGYEPWVAQLERLVVDFLLMGVADSRAHMLPRQPSPIQAPIVSQLETSPVERMESIVADRLGVPWSLNDLAEAAGVSPRVLQMACLRERNTSPMDLLRNMRLDAARRRLQASSFASVTETALEFEFGHLGRFSNYYRERFGELPSETCTRCNSNIGRCAF